MPLIRHWPLAGETIIGVNPDIQVLLPTRSYPIWNNVDLCRVGLLPLLRRHLPYLTRQSKKELTPREKADLEFLKAWNSGSPEQMEKLLPDVVPTEKQPDLESVAREEVKVFKNSCAMDSITSIRERKATPKKSFRLRMPGKGYVHFDQGLLAGLGFTEMRAHK